MHPTKTAFTLPPHFFLEDWQRFSTGNGANTPQVMTWTISSEHFFNNATFEDSSLWSLAGGYQHIAETLSCCLMLWTWMDHVVMLPACILEMMVRILAENSAILTKLFHGFPYSRQSNSRKVPLIRPWLLHSITSPMYFLLTILPMDAILYSMSYWQCTYISFDVSSCLVFAFLWIFTNQPASQPTNQQTKHPTTNQINWTTNQPTN